MKLIAVKEHRSNFPNPLRFKKGERLVVGKNDTEYEGWVWVVTDDGNQGWAPVQHLDFREGNRAAAHRDYDATELDTSLGDELILHYELNDWAWVEKGDGSCGWVPLHTLGSDISGG